jgi:hypothetical protein
VYPPLVRVFVPSILTRSGPAPHSRLHSGEVGMTELRDLNIPPHAKTGLEWATLELLSNHKRLPLAEVAGYAEAQLN